MTHKKQSGFTIVELLIVIVVIGILAAITIVAYNGIQARAHVASLQSDLDQAGKQLETYKLLTSSSSQYPPDLATANLKASTGTVYTYAALSPSSGVNTAYCLNATNSNITYFITSSIPKYTPGSCSGLIGWWPMNNNANDQSGYTNNGIVNGTTFATGYNGNANGAYSFNGTASDYIAVPSFNSSVLEPSSFGASWSLAVWAKWGGIYTNEGVLMGKQGCNGGIYEYTNKYVFAIKGAGCWTGAQTIYGSTLDMSWHFLVATYQAGAMTFYEDGTSQGTAVLADMTGYGDTLGIGSGGTSSYTFNGTLDDARAYNRVLTATEIAALNSAGAQ